MNNNNSSNSFTNEQRDVGECRFSLHLVFLSEESKCVLIVTTETFWIYDL